MDLWAEVAIEGRDTRSAMAEKAVGGDNLVFFAAGEGHNSVGKKPPSRILQNDADRKGQVFGQRKFGT